MNFRLWLLAGLLTVAIVAALMVPVLTLAAGPAPAVSSTQRPVSVLPELASCTVPDSPRIRFATFNVAMNRSAAGELMADLQSASDQLGAGGSDRQSRAVAEILQRVRPDVVLLNEFDYDRRGLGIERFQNHFLGVAQHGQAPIHYAYVYHGPVNTGLTSGVDLDGDGTVAGPNDAFGFGLFPGQYGMVLLSRYPILEQQVRTFQRFLWRDMPDALLPVDYYGEEAKAVLRLSSKSHWDVPLKIEGQVVHVLAAHPTPPVFDGPEDRNGRRNHDEIRFWVDYVGGLPAARYIIDDAGRRGGLGRHQAFVIVGDYNADPVDGDSAVGAAKQFLTSSAIDHRWPPSSAGAAQAAASAGLANAEQRGDAALDTADFNPAGPGNLRVDYVLPSMVGLVPRCAGVFWPTADDPRRYLVGDGMPVVSSDHRLVWLDLELRR